MKMGALIATPVLPHISGVTALLPIAGAISAGQRTIIAFQCAEVSMVSLVVGPKIKKPERQLAQSGVIFTLPGMHRLFPRFHEPTINSTCGCAASSGAVVFILFLYSIS